MIGPSADPIADALAIAEPDTAPNIIEDPTPTCPSPPLPWPRVASASLINLSAMPARCIRSPANTKKGIAIRAKIFILAAIRWKPTTKGISSTKKVNNDEAPSAIATGTPIAISTSNAPSRSASSISAAPPLEAV